MTEEREFRLPRGYRAADGSTYTDGAMRPAVAGDEILPLEDPRVHGNRAYLVILVLARVITRLGPLAGDAMTPAVIEGLYTSDLAYLQSLYRELNGLDCGEREVTCPRCAHGFKVEA